MIAECSAYDFKEMLERKKVKSWLKSVSAFANTDGGSLFYEYPVNEESSVEKFGVNSKSSVKTFGDTQESLEKGSEKKFGDSKNKSKSIEKTAQKIIDFVISAPSMSAETMAYKIET